MKKYLLILSAALVVNTALAQKTTLRDSLAKAADMQTDTTAPPLIWAIETSHTPAIRLDFTKQPIVDINSRLTVGIDRNRLIAALPAAKKSNPALTASLNQLIALLKTEQQILNLIKPATANIAANRDSLSAYSKLMMRFYNTVSQNPSLRAQVNSLFQDAIAKIRNNTFDKKMYASPQAYVIKHLDTLMNQVATDISNEKDVASYHIQLQAYIHTKNTSNQKIHIENFDNYSAGEFYEVPRWVTSFSADDASAFNQVSQLSNALNSAIAGNFKDIVKLIPDSLNSYACYSNLVTEAKNDEAAIAGQAASQANTFITAMQVKLTAVYTAIQQFQKQKNAAGANPIEQFSQLSNAFITLAGSLPAEVDSLKSTVTATAFAASADAKKLYTDFKACNAILQADVKLVSGVYYAVANLLQPMQSNATAAQQLTGSVFDVNINQIPPKGYIDLKYSGKRQNGDEIEIKLVTRSKDDIAKNQPGLTLDDQIIEMQQISFYSESSIGVILASPLGSSSQVTLKNKFQFAPSGSLVVKFGSRTNRFWNTVNPGVGFNISTPDFNLDGTPDVSYGGVLTLFHNIVSAGWAYNTKTSSQFWFFGLSLPFTTFGLPVGNVQTQKQ
jgi:hypothetical protein